MCEVKKELFRRTHVALALVLTLPFVTRSPVASAKPPMAPAALSAHVTTWLSLTDPQHNATPSEFSAFLSQVPDWPRRGWMLSKLQTALAKSDDPGLLAKNCPLFPINNVIALQHCAAYIPNVGAQALRIWRAGREGRGQDVTLHNLLKVQPDAITQRSRFAALLRVPNFDAAKRQIAALPASSQHAAETLLALSRDSGDAVARFESLPPDVQHTPDIMVAWLRRLRISGQYDDCLSWWRNAGFAVQSAHPANNWTSERLRLAYEMLRLGRNRDAYTLAADRTAIPSAALDLDRNFLTGWIALRKMHDVNRARESFSRVAAGKSVISQARGYYWLGRTESARSNQNAARQFYEKAAEFPTTFYGQLALAALYGQTDYFSLASATPPGLRDALQSLRHAKPTASPRPDLIRAAQLLGRMGHASEARTFLMAAWSEARTVSELSGIANDALQLHLNSVAVFSARKAGQLGAALYPQGWARLNMTFPNTVLPSNFVWAVARQESSFDPQVISPARAVGLMQLRVNTAQEVAQKSNVLNAVDVTQTSLMDPSQNLQLGAEYLEGLFRRFENRPPVALAAYNAGPGRVRGWMRDVPLQTDANQLQVIDWIELIPFAETRGYVQRIYENFKVYSAETDQGD